MLNRGFIQSYFYYFIDFQQRSEELGLGHYIVPYLNRHPVNSVVSPKFF